MRPALRGTAQLDGFLKDLRAFCYCTLCIVVIQAKTEIDSGTKAVASDNDAR